MGTCFFFYKNTEQNGPLVSSMHDSRTIVPKNVFLSIKWEPIVPSSESRAEQIGPLSVI